MNGESVGHVDVSSIAAALLRSSSLNTGHPTRTLRITASEKTSRDSTPTPVSAEDLARRPRSNPRSRTPMRYESPLQIDAFRASSPSAVYAETTRSATAVRPIVGLAQGAASSRTIHEDRGPVQPRSAKQGPSQRKIRRWKNEHFAGLAAEIAASSARGGQAADVLMKAHRDAHLYRSIYDFNDRRRSEKFIRYVLLVGERVGTGRFRVNSRRARMLAVVAVSCRAMTRRLPERSFLKAKGRCLLLLLIIPEAPERGKRGR